MKAEKWNPKTEEYEPYELPEGAVFIGELDDIIVCASCGKELTFGNSYVSKNIHSYFGFGYCVCWDCHKRELQEAFEVQKGELQ